MNHTRTLIRTTLLSTLLVTTWLLLSDNAAAQYTANNQTNTISGVVSNWSGDYNIGPGTFSRDALQITNGGVLVVTGGSGQNCIGDAIGSTSNAAVVMGSGSVWSNQVVLAVGNNGAGNSLTISNGGAVYSLFGMVGYQNSGINNTVLVTGNGSVWSNSSVQVGVGGAGNSLTISNGGFVYDGDTGIFGGVLGRTSHASNNTVRVADNGVWRINSTLSVGFAGSSNVLTIAGGSVLAGNAFIGYSDPSIAPGIASNNVLRVDSGSLIVTNAPGSGALVVSRAGGKGTLILNGGSVTVDSLVATNGANSVVTFNGGVLNSKGTYVTNGQNFVVGNGVSAATLNVQGGQHFFKDGLTIAANGTLAGTGTVIAATTINGTVSPGFSIGKLTITGSVHFAAGSVLSIELGGAGTNDLLQTVGALTLDSGSTLQLSGGVLNQTYTIVTNFTSLTGTFDTVTPGYTVSYLSDRIDVTVVVPEPATWILVVSALGSLWLGRRRFRMIGSSQPE